MKPVQTAQALRHKHQAVLNIVLVLAEMSLCIKRSKPFFKKVLRSLVVYLAESINILICQQS